MSPDVGLNSDIKVAKKRLHLQTSLLEEKSLLSLELFQGGELVSRRYQIVDKDVSETDIQDIHNQIKRKIEFLFEIQNDIKQRKHVVGLVHLGRLFMDVGLNAQAVDSFQTALHLDNKIDVHFDLGKAYFETEQFQKALNQFEMISDNYADVYFNKGLALWKLAEYAESLKALKQALNINANYAKANYYYGYILVDSCVQKPTLPDLPSPIERLKQAERYFENASESSAIIDTGTLQDGLKKALDSNFDQGLKLLSQAIPRYHTDADKHWTSEIFLRFMYKDVKEINDIIYRLEALIDQNPEYADLREALGSAYLVKGWYCFSKATSQLKNAVEINPDFEKAVKKVKLLQNDGRGLLILLRAVLK